MGSIPTPNLFKPLEPENFSEESVRVIEFITDYYKNIEKYPVRSQVDPGYLQKCSPNVAPDQPEPLETILADIQRTIMPGITHWQSPNFFAYFQTNVSTAAFLGEMLCSGLNVVTFNWISSPAATELEMIVMDWMGKMLKLPETFLFSGSTGGGSVIHGSTCEALVCTLAAARDRALRNIGPGNIDKLVVYVSDQTHSSVQKGAKLVGIPPANLRIIPTSASTSFGLSANAVRIAIESDLASGLVPLFICATVGTTTCGFVDPINSIGLVAREYNVWLHVDAAFAGSACICPEFRHYLNGVELADSISMNPHKWFLTITDCCCLWLKNPETLIESLSITPEYLRNKPSESSNVVDYKDWQISLSRRFRALKLWLVLRRYGVSNLMAHIRNDVELAEIFEALVLTDNRLELVVPRKFSLVCFRMKPEPDQDGSELNQNLLEAINCSGRAFMTHGVVDGVFVIRCAIGGTLTEECHIDGLWKIIQEKVDFVVSSCNSEAK